ncbi:hypothetical protein Q9Q95_13720 [Sphingomonas sp. DG1-23]|uniref:hypothetical protein n=1 Tax=Sphingomonas sp. DG1-23 TaxID=3068316 RepID=UPI00273DE7B2|nr:hypothetical protein [Sphingomonas sp. DG1-23]MDP5279988.1 hypothetical protein [Sphingomonas sp. DG1-23]
MASGTLVVRKGGGAPLRAPRAGWTPAKRNRFLARLAETLNVRASVRSVNLSEAGLYKLRRRDPAFAAAWDQTIAEAYGRLEMLLLERALLGGGRVRATEGARHLDTLSERALLALVHQHRPNARGLRAATEKVEGSSALEEELGARDRLVAKLAEIEMRLAAEDDA